jgi:hypothetical protein
MTKGNDLVKVRPIDQRRQNILGSYVLSVSITIVSDNDGVGNCLSRAGGVVL